MKKFYDIYQYIAFLVIFPLSCYVLYMLNKDWLYTIYMVSLPLIVSYIVPAIGTNIIKLWRFNTKHKVGNFRLYHGFVLGASTNIFGAIGYIVSPNYDGILSSICFSLLLGAFIGFWNWIYDIYAIENKFIILNSQTAKLKKSSYEIAFDYAPAYFYVFGFIYGIYIKLGQAMYYSNNKNFIWITVLVYIIALTIPALSYILMCKIRHKDSGIFLRK